MPEVRARGECREERASGVLPVNDRATSRHGDGDQGPAWTVQRARRKIDASFPIRMTHAMRLPTLLLCLAALPVAAHDVIPEHEKEAAQRLLADGPKETRGVESAAEIGSVPLDGEIPGAEGTVLRARHFVLAPGAQIAVHEHQQRPGMAYVLEGELTEYRNDADAPIKRGVGAAAFERTGVVHWWKNETDRPARALVVDIVDAAAR